MNKELFLLGGHDLEMLEIKKLLESNNKKIVDKNLKWGAKLSDYSDDLDFDGIIYGIELEADVALPKNYKTIDHHGENSHMPSSLKQIANILNINLTKEQKLIAANDSEYIYGMKKLCATDKEIQDIRAEDRKAQGVTKKDEELAKQNVSKASTNIVSSLSPNFSILSDLLYYKYDNYIIFNEKKIVFYGYEVSQVREFLEHEDISEDSYYYGGGKLGFVGIKDDILDFESIKNLLKKFENTQKDEEKLYSYHTFMFPFIFDTKGKVDKEKWIYKEFEIKEQRDYNEFTYFYKHVQDALYNAKDIDSKKFISKYFAHKDGEKGTYTIDCVKGNFELVLDGISLRVFNTGIGILSFNLKNNRYQDQNEILAINDFGRRIYPQFLGHDFTQDTKESILAYSITLKVGDEETIEDFKYFDNKTNLKKPNRLPSFIATLLDSSYKKIEKIIDDRMFVISQFNNDKIVSELQVYCEDKERYIYENDDWWYKYIFVDGGDKTSQSKHMTKKLIGESSYDRWIEYGTLFGLSRYSFVSVTGSWYGKNILLAHTQTMYFQMFSLLLAYRASIINFSNNIQDVTNDKKNISSATQVLYENYLNFLNQLYFKEVTAQDQGVELYNKAMKVMDIEKYMFDLDNEINELHSYVDILEEKRTNKKLNFLTYLGGLLLPPTIITGFLGMNTLDGLREYVWFDKSENGVWSIVIILISALILPIYLKLKKDSYE